MHCSDLWEKGLSRDCYGGEYRHDFGAIFFIVFIKKVCNDLF